MANRFLRAASLGAALLGPMTAGCSGDGSSGSGHDDGGTGEAGGASGGGSPGSGSGGGTSNAGRSGGGGQHSGGTAAVNGGSAGAGAGAGGASNRGGGANAGGNANAGGSPGDGGASGAGGDASAGGAGSGNGGAPVAGDGGAGGAGGNSSACKRGIAANTAPGAAFFPAVKWWYNWAVQPSGADVGVEFVPMIWGAGSVNASLPSGAEYLLTFNEPNFHAQSNLTAAAAAGYWPTIEAKAAAAGVPIVGPGMNFCGPAANCNGTNPYRYYEDFFAACTGCKVDYVAVHWYNCDLPSLRDYLEPGGGLEGFEQFGRPIWLTEFSCNGSASVADQEAFMRAAIPYLESNPHVFRYSWFSAGPIPNAKLMNDDGSPNALGNVYIGLDQNCR